MHTFLSALRLELPTSLVLTFKVATSVRYNSPEG